MKIISAYETDVARVYVIETSPAIASGQPGGPRSAVTEEARWGLDVPEADSYAETRRLYLQRAAPLVPLRRRLTAREGRDL